MNLENESLFFSERRHDHDFWNRSISGIDQFFVMLVFRIHYLVCWHENLLSDCPFCKPSSRVITAYPWLFCNSAHPPPQVCSTSFNRSEFAYSYVTYFLFPFFQKRKSSETSTKSVVRDLFKDSLPVQKVCSTSDNRSKFLYSSVTYLPFPYFRKRKT